MSAEQNQIQLYVNLEPSALASKESCNSLNFATYFDHLLRAVEIPMIQFLEQLHNEAAVRAQNNVAATPREFQMLLREFVRDPSEQRQQVFLEHLRSGKHSIEHLGTIALLTVRTLTQSLAGEDYELVALAQSQNDAARFYVQTGMTFAKLFLDAISEAARQMDRNPTCFSRRVKSKEYLENRAIVRAQIAASLRASINDIAIKAYSSLRQHIAERTLKLSNSNAVLQEQRQNTIGTVSFPAASGAMAAAAPTTTTLVAKPTTIATPAAVAAAAPIAPQQQPLTQPTTNAQVGNVSAAPAATTIPAVAKQQEWQSIASPPDTPPPITLRKPTPQAATTTAPITATKNAIMDFDQRASPLSSNEAKLAQKDLVQSLLNISTRATQMQQQQQEQKPDQKIMQEQKPDQKKPHELKPSATLARVRLEGAGGSRSVETSAARQIVGANELVRAHSDSVRKSQHDEEDVMQSDQVLESLDLLTKDE